MQTQYLYLNGHITPVDEAAISPFDIGLLRGYAVFDLLRTVGGRPFLLAEHLERFRASAQELGLSVPATDDEIVSAIADLLARNGHREATVRLVLTGGVSPDGMTFDPAEPTFYILTHELHEPPASLYETGGKLLMREHKRELPRAKTTNYLTMLHGRHELGEAGALDLLYHDGTRIFEAASASVYFVRGNTILAPRDDVLWGTVGTLVMRLAQQRYSLERREVSLEEALEADEAFLTSTTRGVVPIVQLGDTRLGDGLPGPVTRELIALWREEIARG
jgi:branched-chain amino acid aminotransferase